MVDHDVKDLARADEGRLRIEWADQAMPVLDATTPALRVISRTG